MTVARTAPVLRVGLDNYLKRSGVKITPTTRPTSSMEMSFMASTGGVGLLPAYAKNFLPSVTSRPLKEDTSTIELVLGYKKSNESPLLN